MPPVATADHVKTFGRRMATKATATARAAFGLALDTALPSLCPSCREQVADPGALCATCWGQLSFIARPYCERMGTPFAYDPGPGIVSAQAIADPPAFDRAARRCRTRAHAFKYGDRINLAPGMGRWMARAGAEPRPTHLFRAAALAPPMGAALQSGGDTGAGDPPPPETGVPVAHDILGRVARPASRSV